MIKVSQHMIPQRQLGKNGLKVSAIGYGAMGLEGYYGATDEPAGIETLRHALDLGVNFIDTADFYGSGHNEELVGRAIKGRRNDCIVASKFGIVFEAGEKSTAFPTQSGFSLPLNGTAAYARRCLDKSLRRLGIETVDLWYLHWPDLATPIEETVTAMAEGVRVGKARYLGLSNVTADQLRRAHKIHPIAAVQYEYSLWRREPEKLLFPTLRELGVGFVPWSPLGCGFLTGVVPPQFSKGDFRINNPRFKGDNFKKNTDHFAPLMSIAKELGITPAQLALAWLLHQGGDIVPIPGSRRTDRVAENAKAASVRLSPEVLKRMSELAPVGVALGATLID
jgi:aryl-alcohol dehydrogenase-like predicted oxidoreductase